MTSKKILKTCVGLMAAVCLIAVFVIIWGYTGARLGEKAAVDSAAKEASGTWCTIKSNGLDGVPVFAEAGSTEQTAFFPEGKCCALLARQTVDGQEWMQVSYCGLTGWLKESRVHFISDGKCDIGPGTIAYVNADTEKGVKGYEEPSAQAPVVEEGFGYGSEFTVKEVSDGWGLVERDGKTFWMNMYFMGSYPVDTWKVESLSSAGEINLREGPGEEEKVLGKVPEGTALVIGTFQNGWGQTTYQGVTGWVMLHYLTPTDGQAQS